MALGIPGIKLTASADDDGVERWFLVWTPAFEGSLVEAARYGGSREQAVTARLLERAADITSDPAAAADLVLEAALCGVARLSAFAMAVARPGALVVLDEPTNDVDPVRRQLLWDEVRRVADDGAAVLLVTHNVREAERAVDSLVLLDHGKILTKGTTASVVSEFGGGFRLDVDVARGAVPAFPDGWGVHRHDAAHWSVSVPEGGGVEAAEWATHARAAGQIVRYELGPVSLEEVYVALTTEADGTRAA